MKILCDQMLGTLAKWLRILGFDTFYANKTISDDELLDIAQKQKRYLITRDKELVIRGKKKKLNVIHTKTTDLDKQIAQVLDQITIDKKLILTRCTHCNSVIDSINKKDVKNKVPKKVFEYNDKFWYCKKCDKYYWQGGHYDNIIKKIKELKKI